MPIKRYAFYLNPNIDEEAKLLVFLEHHGNSNYAKYIKEILTNVRLGILVKPDQEDLQKKKLITDIKFKEVMIKIKEQELIYKQTFEQTPPQRHKQAMKIHVETQDPNPKFISSIDEKNNRLMCAECGACFVFSFDQHDKGESKEKFIDHYFAKHKDKLVNSQIPLELQKELRDF